ncbi:WD40 repeat domain-containing protein [Waterburya agarophytonicola K14]|uniref:WD40 repeat domain-containing protein n=1 Tax=Waterburya agarophytonicola KI4 TaxID=2874699 RepID=A0A964BVS0_9CYAN|nr:WD40 repeat domain-containing protein [Waterburya agarophytonicola]MCC0179526.1 WD40 repeat domain-containing protein [Waterburya agarophytonicola KI4]
MGNRFYVKYLLAMAIALGQQSVIFAQVESRDSTDSIANLQNRLSSPWENAVLSHTLESITETNAIEFSPDGKILATVEASQILLWRTDLGEIQRILPTHHASKSALAIAPTAIAFSPDSRFLATTTWSQGLLTPDDSLIVWDTATGAKIFQISESAGCGQVVFDVSGEILYGACDGGVTAWSFPQGDKLFSFDLQHPVEAIALKSDGTVMATVDVNISGQQQSHVIQLWALDRDKPVLLNTLDGHVNDIAQIEFTADGKRLVSSSYDGKIKVWNWQKGEIYQKTNNLHSSNGLFSLSGNSRLIAGNFHSSAMTNLITGLPLRNVMPPSRQERTKIVAFSPQGDLFAQVRQSDQSNRQQIYLWKNEPSNSQPKSSIEDDYLSLSIAKYWANSIASEVDTNTYTGKPSPIGTDPQKIALAALGLTEIVESEEEQVEINYPQDNLAFVTLTQTNLADDSVAGLRYLVKFAPYGDRQEKQYRVVWAGKQFKCYGDRGNANWKKNLCQ